MSELRIENWRLPAAPMGADNPLPRFDAPSHQPVLSPKSADDPETGYLPDYLPYTVQDGYSRQHELTDLRVAVLENDILRATFLLEYGGRLWSLIHKPSNRELLFVNPVLQPGNLAIRNAWFSGGVEWNIGIIGHTPYTCSPLFAARIDLPDGNPALRLYEWERIRQVAYQIDAYLPDGSAVLYVRCRIINPFDHALPMYWWSNMAVPQGEDVRVLTPAAEAYQYALSLASLRTVALPVVDGVDITYTTNSARAADYFFRIPERQRPWITALDGEGKGLVQVSTDVLRGRKLFMWGTGSGGQRWQEWLNTTNHSYLEIQAGLASTQLEYALMQPHAELEWLEAYGLMQADPQTVHGSDWDAARIQIEDRIEQLVPRTDFDAELRRGDQWKDQPPTEIIHRGSGWGLLETLRRRTSGQKPFSGDGLDFKDSITAEQRPWLELLQSGVFPENDTDDTQAGIITQSEWHTLLERSLDRNLTASWEAYLHLGTMRLHAGDVAGARAAWEISLTRKRTAWALRNLAVLVRRRGELDKSAELYIEAQRLKSDLLPLWIETARTLIDANRSADFLALLDKADHRIRKHGRIQLLEVEAGLSVNDLERVGERLDAGFEIVDYREGDEVLTELWVRYHAERLSRDEQRPINAQLLEQVRREHPIPDLFDFRMNVPKAK